METYQEVIDILLERILILKLCDFLLQGILLLLKDEGLTRTLLLPLDGLAFSRDSCSFEGLDLLLQLAD